mmetsp:Transcript_5020/g.14059  ORF Transcript_5020/g.14059 Transcript_5020/m.14059 type:complete len:95 (+) Transcript_5020:1762-2046(+)
MYADSKNRKDFRQLVVSGLTHVHKLAVDYMSNWELHFDESMAVHNGLMLPILEAMETQLPHQQNSWKIDNEEHVVIFYCEYRCGTWNASGTTFH